MRIFLGKIWDVLENWVLDPGAFQFVNIPQLIKNQL